MASTTHEPVPAEQQPQGDDGRAERSAPPPEVLTRRALRQCALERQSIERRAIEAINWGMPAVNYDLMRQAMLRDAGGAEELVGLLAPPVPREKQKTTPKPPRDFPMP